MSEHSKMCHLLFAPIPAYGHIRPSCALAVRLAAGRNIIITIIMPPNWLQQARSDVAAQFPNDREALERIRILSSFDSTETELFALMPLSIEHYPTAYGTLLAGKPIECASTGMVFAAVPPPSALILDIFALQQLYATRSITGTIIPIFTFVAGNAASLVRLFGPEWMDGKGDLGAKIDAESLRVGKSVEEVGDQMFRHTDGTLINIPGIPAMYDYECFPQISYPGPMASLSRVGVDMLKACDGVFVACAPASDGEGLVAFEAWVRDTLHKPLYAVGPLLPLGYGGEQSSSSPKTPRAEEMKLFLDSMGSKYGDKSVLFISFGTIFWPRVEGQLEDLIDALVEKEFPFILCYASPFAILSGVLLQKIQASGIGMASTWAQQQFILTHPATGWFLTHCGNGGVTEALASGVPMICWPFEADQPVAAMHLVHNLNVAFPLLEIRTGKGLQPLHSKQMPKGTHAARCAEFREVIDHCRDEEGIEKRRNAELIRGELAKAWGPGGSAVLAVNKFFAAYVPTA
ncbi:hypothetical protein B0H19DRAFT_1160311 [Mycena capillaripes]|nr:hypothetical protein B0H19DRAFT_1160311 [Mycena capillaripes]